MHRRARSRAQSTKARVDLAREIAQDRRVPDLAPPAQKGRDAVRSPQAYSEARSAPTTRAERRPRRVPPRRDRSEPPQTRQADPDAVAALSDVRQQSLLDLGHSPTPGCRDHSKTDFFNGIGQTRTHLTSNMSFRSAPLADLPGRRSFG